MKIHERRVLEALLKRLSGSSDVSLFELSSNSFCELFTLPLRIVVCDQSTLTRYLMKPICGLINFLKKSL